METNCYTISFAASNNNLSSYYATFVSDKSSVPFDATINGKTLSASQSIKLTSDVTIRVNSMTWIGNLFISTEGFDSNTPVYTVHNDDDTNRFQCIEFSGQPASITADVSYINWYSIPLMITNSSTNTSFSVPIRGFSQEKILNDLKNLSNNSQTVVIKDNKLENFLRVISPNALGSYIAAYPNFKNYIEYIFDDYDNNNASISLENRYSGQRGSTEVTTMRQDYKNTNDYGDEYVYYGNNTLKIDGHSTILDENTGKPTGTLTSFHIEANNLDINSFSRDIYIAQLNYSWTIDYTIDGHSYNKKNDNASVGDNDVFSAIVRDLLAGLSFGFIGSNVAVDDYVNYGDTSSSFWQGTSGYPLFSDLDPDGSDPSRPHYNPWADVFYKYFSHTYSFPFSDFIQALSPQLNINSGENLLVTILD
jgi:hypothetical protein